MHIHPSSPNSSQALPEEIAATKIQAGFRGYRVRKQLKETDTPRQQKITTFNSSNNSNNNNHNSNNINNKENYRLNKKLTDDSPNPATIGYNLRNNKLSSNANGGPDGIEDKSATKIQAGVRGFLVRKKQKAATDAATKIQASFRGFKVRKEIKKNRK